MLSINDQPSYLNINPFYLFPDCIFSLLFFVQSELVIRFTNLKPLWIKSKGPNSFTNKRERQGQQKNIFQQVLQCALIKNSELINMTRYNSSSIFFYYYKNQGRLCNIILMETPITFIDEYKVLALVGDGGQANVYLCVKNFKMYAIKVFNSGMSHGEAFNRETKFLSLLQEHPNLIKMHEANAKAVIKNVDGTQITKSIIVLEYAQKGDLFEYISITKAFKAEFCRTIFKSVLNGIEHLNELGITHRDMKPQNILFNHDFQLKITDFGLSTLGEGAEKDFILTTKVGTEGFKAPQVDSGQYNGHKADIFAIGVILFMLYAGSPPFLSTNRLDKIYKHIMNKNFQKFWSIHEKNRAKGYFPANFKNLINSMLSGNPEDRPTIQQIRENQWLSLEAASNESLQSELHARFEKISQESKTKEKIETILEKNAKKMAKKEQKTPEIETSVEQSKEIQKLFESNQKEVELKSQGQ